MSSSIHYNPLTKEPYLRLPSPHSSIIITPHRLDNNNNDNNNVPATATANQLVTILNDDRVYPWLDNPPHPYTFQDAEEYIRLSYRVSEPVLDVLRQELGGSPPDGGDETQPPSPSSVQYFDINPFKCIREVLSEDPKTGTPLTDIFIGDVGMARYGFYEYSPDSVERREAKRHNNELAVGDPNILWVIGDYLIPTHHGRGIMTAAVKTVIDEYAMPRMNAHIIKAGTLLDNHGSVRVLRKNGFEIEQMLPDWEAPERTLAVLTWRRT